MKSLRITVAAICLALVGCGQSTDTDTDTGTDPDTDTADGSTTPRASDSDAPSGQSISRDTWGVTKTEWPDDLDGAKELFERMPKTFAGAERKLPRFFGGSAGVTYGRGNDAPIAWVMRPSRGVPDATAALAVMFGMTMACDKDSYRGTAPRSDYGSVPDADRSGAYDPDGGWWFACTIDGAEGDPDFTGQAVGWAVGDLAWLTTTPDRATSRALVEALREAAGS